MDVTSTASTKDTVGGSSDTASTSYNPLPEMSAEQEFFLYELETTDSGSIGLVLRAIYDCGDVHNFSRALEHRIHQYDRNIQKVCSFHYQGFVDSMKDLLKLKEECTGVKAEALAIDQQVQAASADITKKSNEIVKYRKLMKNATTAIDQISVCLPVLENYAKLQDLMRAKKFYQALKVLEELEHTHLALVEKYRFTQILAKGMIPVRKQIKEKAYSEFKDFLENIKKVAVRIGRHASKCIAEQHSFGMSEMERARKLMEESKRSGGIEVELCEDGSLVKKSTGNSNKRISQAESLEDDEQMSAQDLIDFTPVHRCCQIFNVLGAKEEFDEYYRQQRLEQCDLVIEPPQKMNSLKHYVDYLDEIIGFFVVEDHVLLTEPSLVTKSHKDQLWETALKRVIHTMNTRFGGSPDVEMMLRMKKVILLFALTMKSYDYGITPLYSLLQNFRDQYNEILMSEYCAQFERDLEVDNYAPISVETDEEFRAVVKQFPFYKRSMESEPFPRKFPFSKFVISVYSQSKSYLVGCLKFMEHLQLTQSEIDDTVRRYANVLLSRWSGSLRSFVQKKRTLVQLVQITVNIGYLEKSCESLGAYITRLTSGADGAITSSIHQLALSDKVFRDARSEVEQQIDECIRAKVDEFLDLAQYDWELPTSSGRASEYISDLINFLSTTFISFTNLPSVLARHVCMQTCKHLAARLTGMMLAPEVRAVSTGALEQFSLDVMQCELFTSQCPVSGFDHHTLPITFAHLRQLLDLVMSSDWTTYLAEYGQDTGRYVRVTANNAITLLEKMVEFEKKSMGFFGMNRGDRKKLLDTILRQLRNLANQ